MVDRFSRNKQQTFNKQQSDSHQELSPDSKETDKGNLNNFRKSLINLGNQTTPEQQRDQTTPKERKQSDRTTPVLQRDQITPLRRIGLIAKQLGAEWADEFIKSLEWEEKKSKSPDPSRNKENTKKLAQIGAGIAIACNQSANSEIIDHKNSVRLEQLQPWAEQRGKEGVISHARHLINPNLHEITKPEDKWQLRSEFSKDIESVFRASEIERREAEVTGVEEINGWYKITYINEGRAQDVYAEKAVIGMGAGDHALRFLGKDQVVNDTKAGEEDLLAQAKNKRIMNMDIFAKVGGKLAGPDTTFLVVGGRAGVGPVYKVINVNSKAEWLAGPEDLGFFEGISNYGVVKQYLEKRSEDIRNAITEEKDIEKRRELISELEGNKKELERIQKEGVLEKHYHKEQAEDYDEKVLEKINKNNNIQGIYQEFAVGAEKQDKKVEATLADGRKIKGDYMVYAMGPDLAPLKTISSSIKKELVPKLDINRRVSKNANELAMVGLQTKDGNLQIVGATYTRLALELADQLAPHLDADFSKRASGLKPKDVRREAQQVVSKAMQRMLDTLGGNIVAPDQAAAIRVAEIVSSDFIPRTIEDHVDYGVHDQQLLADHISSNYRYIADYKLSPAEKEQEVIKEIEKETGEECTTLGDVIVQLIIKSRAPDFKGKPDSLLSSDSGVKLPSGPDGGSALPKERSFRKYWGETIKGLNEQLKQEYWGDTEKYWSSEVVKSKAKKYQELADEIEKLLNQKPKL